MGIEIDFLPVGAGNADAILVRYGDQNTGYTIHLIDGGYKETSETIANHIDGYYGGQAIDHMVLSHADDDHAIGLIEVLKNREVRNLWMNRPWKYAAEVMDHFHGSFTPEGLADKMRQLHPFLAELEAIAERRKIPIHDAFQDTQIGAFTVLAPSRERYIRLIPEMDKVPVTYSQDARIDHLGGIGLLERAKAVIKWIKETWQRETLADGLTTSASNESSLVQLATFNGSAVLLTSDVGCDGLEEAAVYAHGRGILAPPGFVQVPHHGSRHNIGKTVLNWWLGMPVADPSVRRGVAYCSVGAGEDAKKYPRRVVSNAFLRRGYPVHVTRGGAKCHRIDMPARNWGQSVPLPFSADVEE